MIRLDSYTRLALLGSGVLGAYSLGANNIANVIAVFLPSQPFPALSWRGFESSPTQLLLMVGGIAMASGVLTYSRRIMELVGSGLANLSTLAAWICVSTHSIVLLLFASASLKAWLQSKGLPSLPLVPVSSSQAILGAILGVGLLRCGRDINFLNMFPPRKFFRFSDSSRRTFRLLCRKLQESEKCGEMTYVSSYLSKSSRVGIVQ